MWSDAQRIRKMRFQKGVSNNAGENNPMYLGDDVGYNGVHTWVRKRKPKPELCERCGLVPPLDLANISGEYNRDLDNYKYLCRKCHMDSDGRNDLWRASSKSRKLEQKFCATCEKPYYRTSGQRTSKFCSRACFSTSRLGKITNPLGTNQWRKD